MKRTAMKILVVDDECHICDLLDEFLTMIGFHVFTASNGEMAIDRFETEKPDIVCLDIRMPGLDGIEILRRIKATGREFGVIMLSAFGDQQTIDDAVGAGADYYLQKPIDFVLLKEKLSSLQLSLQARRTS